LKKSLKESIINLMNQTRYTVHTFSEAPTLAVRSGNTNNDTTNQNREYALDEVSLLLAKSFKDSGQNVTTPPVAQMREQLREDMNPTNGILVWIEDTQPREGRTQSEAVGYALIGGEDLDLSGIGYLRDIYAIPGDDKDQIVDSLMKEGIAASREGGYSELKAYGIDMPEGLLDRHGFKKEEDPKHEGDPLYQLDLSKIGGENEQGNPPMGIPSSGNI
jgi:hypothetical protein